MVGWKGTVDKCPLHTKVTILVSKYGEMQIVKIVAKLKKKRKKKIKVNQIDFEFTINISDDVKPRIFTIYAIQHRTDPSYSAINKQEPNY